MAGSERPLRALVLTAGLGTRLRPLSCVRAKPAVPVNGEPLVRRILRWLARHGIRDVVLNLHHRPATITSAVGDGSDLGLAVRYSWEQPVLGSAGGPRRALPLLDSDDAPFLIVNGDTLTNLDVRALQAAHRGSGAAVTMAVIQNPRPDKYGGVRATPDGAVTTFAAPARTDEVEPAGAPERSYHFIGVQVAHPRVFAGLADGVPAETVRSLYPELMRREPGAVRVFVSAAAFHDIGTPRDYLETSFAIAALEGDRLACCRNLAIPDSARITRSVLWDDVVIGDGASLHECVVADGVRVPAGARYERLAIVPAAACEPRGDERVEGGLLLRSL
jgi:NDP-sugar pyrophosphorylase family protein